MRIAVSILLSDEERATLTKWAQGRSTEARLVLRAKIVLAAASGAANKEIATDLSTDSHKGVHPDNAALHVEQRAAGIAGIDGCIGLDQIGGDP